MKTFLLSIAVAILICILVVAIQLTSLQSTIGDLIMLFILIGAGFFFYVLYSKERFR